MVEVCLGPPLSLPFPSLDRGFSPRCTVHPQCAAVLNSLSQLSPFPLIPKKGVSTLVFARFSSDLRDLFRLNQSPYFQLDILKFVYLPHVCSLSSGARSQLVIWRKLVVTPITPFSFPEGLGDRVQETPGRPNKVFSSSSLSRRRICMFWGGFFLHPSPFPQAPLTGKRLTKALRTSGTPLSVPPTPNPSFQLFPPFLPPEEEK